MKVRSTQFRVFIFGCLTLLISISHYNAFGITFGIPTESYPSIQADIGAYIINPSITNCIIRENLANHGATASSIYFNNEGETSGEGNMDVYPAWVSAAVSDNHLNNFSPCIFRDTNIGAPGTDIEGNSRPYQNFSNPGIVAYESIFSFSSARPLSVFAMEVGNQWVYDSDILRIITKIDRKNFPTDTYEMEILENGVLMAKEWYQTTESQMLFWGQESGGSLFKFDIGLLIVWYPLSVGEQKKSSAAVVGYPGTTVNMTVDVLSFEEVNLSLGIFGAYKLRYNFTVTSPEGISYKTYDWWVVSSYTQLSLLDVPPLILNANNAD